MKSGEAVQFKSDSISLINLIIRYWKTILLTGIIALMISAAISLKITPLFRSSVILYPSVNVVESQALLGIQATTTALFGDETATEKILQILRSDDIKDFLVNKYDLINRYGIKENARYKYTLLNKRMNKYIKTRKTQYNSVEISVLDADPSITASMANDIAEQIDTIFNRIVKKAGRKSYDAINNSYREQFLKVKNLEDSLHHIGFRGLFSGSSGKHMAGSSINTWIAASGQYSPEMLRMMNMFESENENLSAISSRLTEAKMSAEQDLPYIHIINKAKVSEKKAVPKRSVIVIVSTISTLLLLTFILALSESVVRNDK